MCQGFRFTFHLLFAIFLIYAVFSAPSSAQYAHWDLEGTLLSLTGQPPLVPEAFPPASSPEIRFVSDCIHGVTCTALEFSRGTGFLVAHGFQMINDIKEINQYTLIFDIKFLPDETNSWPAEFICLMNSTITNIRHFPGSVADGEWFISAQEGLGVEGIYKGKVLRTNQWYRLALVIHQPEGLARYYVDGELVNSIGNFKEISRYSLFSTFRLLADNDEENSAGRISCLQIRQESLSPQEIASLGKVSSEGIPLPARPSILDVTIHPEHLLQAEKEYTLNWSSKSSQGFVHIDLYKKGQLIKRLHSVHMKKHRFHWRIPPTIDDSDGYRIHISWLNNPNVSALSKSFTIRNPRTPLNPSFGKQLIRNPYFEEGFTHWKISKGTPILIQQKIVNDQVLKPKYSSTYVTSNSLGDCSLQQTIDLLSYGFQQQQLDEPVRVHFFMDGQLHEPNYHEIIFNFRLNRQYATLEFLDLMDRKITSVFIERLYEPKNNYFFYLPAGTRKIRITVDAHHIINPINDFLLEGMSLSLHPDFPPPEPKFVLEPWLQQYRNNSLTVMWETNTIGYPSFVEWGRSSVDERITKTSTIHLNHSYGSTKYIHKAILNPLEPGTRYVYRVRFRDQYTKTYSFKTAFQKNSPFEIAWLSDTDRYLPTLKKILPNIKKHNPHLLISAGRIGRGGGKWGKYWFIPLKDVSLAQTIPLIHSGSNGDSATFHSRMYTDFPGKYEWNAFTYGNSRFVFLDSYYKDQEKKQVYPADILCKQDPWLINELQSPEWRNADFRIIICYHPPYSNYKRDEDYFDGNARVRKEWVPLFEKYGADLVISGYVSAYQRGTKNGVTYLTIGGAGLTLRPEHKVKEWGFWDKIVVQHHFGIMQGDSERLVMEIYNDKNERIDRFELNKNEQITSQ